jgi:hypothetical protein
MKTLQNAPRDVDNKLQALLETKEREKQQEAIHTHRRHTKRLVTEIEMLLLVLYLVARRRS